jgi:hypothetical protein
MGRIVVWREPTGSLEREVTKPPVKLNRRLFLWSCL